ncbi:MAG: dihydroorotase [Methanolinea sp.]|nr:dihydroorotase [Methanolinea sp.]
MVTGSGRCDLVLRDVSFPDGRVADISVRGGKVCHVGAGYPSFQEISCRGKTVLPGAIDMHVHMRGRSQKEKEDWGSGTRSALAGGVTVVVDQPNTIPPLTTPASFRERVREARESSLCHFAINAGAEEGMDVGTLWREGPIAFGEIFTAPSSYGTGIRPGALAGVLRSVALLGGLCTIHAESPGEGRDVDLLAHNAIRSAGGEAAAVSWVRQVNSYPCRLHFCHLSSAEAVMSAGNDTVEVTPHHLLLSLDDFSPSDPHGKVNPPLRTATVREELWSVWERIDVLASDHAPHTCREKDQAFPDAPSGVPGVETMIPLCLAACRKRHIPVTTLVEKTCWNPARILGIPKAGYSTGERADFAIYPPGETPVRGDELHSRAGWSPFEGMPAVFPDIVIMGGDIVYREGDFFPGRPQWFMGRGYIGETQRRNGADTARP